MPVSAAAQPPEISIVIPTLNEEVNLRTCLASIAIQKYPKEAIEIIVVDNVSNDGTADVARAAGATLLTSAARDAYPVGARLGS